MRKLRPLRLGWAVGTSRADNPDAVDADKDFRRVRPSILERDGHRCVYCNLISMRWQDVHHLDGDHAHNDPDNLVTACRLCHLCQHAGFVGARNMGTLVWMPEVDQVSLNHIQRTLWVAKSGASREIRQQSAAALESIYMLEELMERIVGFSDPKVLVNQLMLLDSEALARAYANQLSGMRLVFYDHLFTDYINHWANDAYRGTPPKDWAKIAASLLSPQPA